MNERDLQEIKERAEEAKRLLGHGSNTLNLIEYDVPKLVAKVEELRAEIDELKIELKNAGVCPHGNLYNDRDCISCFGDGKLVVKVEELTAEIDELKIELENAGVCPHGNLYDDRDCISCFGDGTEEMRKCSNCNTETWHRGDKCLRHDVTAPKPNENIKSELEQLRGKIETAKVENSARIAEAEERLKSIESSSAAMRNVLEYVRGRLGSVNIGESLHKIDQALSASPAASSKNNDNKNEVSDVNGEGLKLDR